MPSGSESNPSKGKSWTATIVIGCILGFMLILCVLASCGAVVAIFYRSHLAAQRCEQELTARIERLKVGDSREDVLTEMGRKPDIDIRGGYNGVDDSSAMIYYCDVFGLERHVVFDSNDRVVSIREIQVW